MMTPGERPRGGSGVKVAPFSDLGGAITYKRRRRDGGDSGGTRSGGSEAEVTRLWRDSFLSNGALEPDKIGRIATNWRNALESLMQEKDVTDDDGAKFCIKKALACGPFGFSDQLYDGSIQTEESFRGNGEVNVNFGGRSTRQSLRSSRGNSEVSLHGTNNLGDQQPGVNTVNCQNALCDILISEKFALLCDLVGENFTRNQASSFFNLRSVFSKMKKGIYEQSTDSFDQDMQLVWEKYLRIGQEMVVLSSSLLSISQQSYQRRVQIGRTPGSVPIVGDQNHVLNDVSNSMQFLSGCLTNQQSTKESVRDTNNVDSNTTTVFTSHESDPSTKAEPLDPFCLSKVITCYHCGLEADGNKSLICDGCEAVHHVSCIDPPVKEIPKRTWYCAACSSSRGESTFPALTFDQQDFPHQNCVVCERLNSSALQAKAAMKLDMIPVPTRSRECSVSSMEGDESPEPSRTAVMRLCKQCGTCEDEEKRFLVCSNKHCLYKYYHIRCLKSTQLASKRQPPGLWYCPSCLCRGCLVDKDDDLICLCDDCDEGYHIYCMNPPWTTTPKGTWYCFRCNVERAKKGMKMYEQQVLRIHGKNDIKPGKQLVDEKSGSGETLEPEIRGTDKCCGLVLGHIMPSS